MMMQTMACLAADGLGTPPPTRIHVVLVAGQSNAEGVASGAELPTEPVNLRNPQANIPFYYHYLPNMFLHDKNRPDVAAATDAVGTFTSLRPGSSGLQSPGMGFGPEITLGAQLAPVIEKRPGERLAIIKFAKGATALVPWWTAGGDDTPKDDGECYRIFQRAVKDGLAALRATYPNADARIAAMIWVQGESDSLSPRQAEAYGDNLSRLIGDVRKTFGDGIPFVLSRLSDQQLKYAAPDSPTHAGFLAVRRCQEQVAASVPSTYMLDTDGPSFNVRTDRIHFSAAGQQALGVAFAEKIEAILAGTKDSQRMDVEKRTDHK